jgi:hypothetical protein
VRAGTAMAQRQFAQRRIAKSVGEGSDQTQYVAPLDRSTV